MTFLELYAKLGRGARHDERLADAARLALEYEALWTPDPKDLALMNSRQLEDLLETHRAHVVRLDMERRVQARRPREGEPLQHWHERVQHLGRLREAHQRVAKQVKDRLWFRAQGGRQQQRQETRDSYQVFEGGMFDKIPVTRVDGRLITADEASENSPMRAVVAEKAVFFRLYQRSVP